MTTQTKARPRVFLDRWPLMAELTEMIAVKLPTPDDVHNPINDYVRLEWQNVKLAQVTLVVTWQHTGWAFYAMRLDATGKESAKHRWCFDGHGSAYFDQINYQVEIETEEERIAFVDQVVEAMEELLTDPA